MPEDRCSNCRSFDYECTYVEGSTVSALIFILHWFVKLRLRGRSDTGMQGSPLLLNLKTRLRSVRPSYVQGLENELASLRALFEKVRAFS